MGRLWETLLPMTTARSRYLFVFLLLGLLSQVSCSGPGQLADIILKPGEHGATRDDPVSISATASATTSVQFVLSSVGGYTGDVSILVFPDPLKLEDINDVERTIGVSFFPPRPYTFTDTVDTLTVTVTFDAEDGLVPPEDALYRIKVSAGAVGELVDSGVDLYFKIVP